MYAPLHDRLGKCCKFTCVRSSPVLFKIIFDDRVMLQGQAALKIRRIALLAELGLHHRQHKMS